MLAGCLSESEERDGGDGDPETAPDDRTENDTADGTATTTDGTLAFLVPSPLSGSEPRIRIEGTDASWALPDAARDRLATPPPSFALDSLEVPDSVTLR